MGRIALAASVGAAIWIAGSGDVSAQAYGSFVQSCVEIVQRGPFLRALCRDQFGRFIPATLDLRACPDGRAANVNGRLVCEGYGRRSRPRYFEDDGYGYGGPHPRYYEPPPRYYQPY